MEQKPIKQKLLRGHDALSYKQMCQGNKHRRRKITISLKGQEQGLAWKEDGYKQFE